MRATRSRVVILVSAGLLATGCGADGNSDDDGPSTTSGVSPASEATIADDGATPGVGIDGVEPGTNLTPDNDDTPPISDGDASSPTGSDPAADPLDEPAEPGNVEPD